MSNKSSSTLCQRHPIFLSSKKENTLCGYKEASCDLSDDEEEGEQKKAPRTESLGFPFKVEGSLGWAGNLPCVHGPTEGCSRHNENKLPIAWNKRVPSTKKKPTLKERLFGPPPVAEYDEVRRSERIWSTLHMDHSTADPIDPLNASIPYALAYYHLDWVRSGGSAEIQKARANTLTCHGKVAGNSKCPSGVEYWVRPLWHNNSFLLKQVVRFTISPRKLHPLFGYDYIMLGWSSEECWTFRTCPHYRQRFLSCEFQQTRGLMKSTVSYATKQRSFITGDYSSRTTWESVYGPRNYAFNCQYCLTDSRIFMEMVEDKVVVHLHVWKDLGKAKDAFDPRWLAALRPEGTIFKRSREERKQSDVRVAVQEAMDEESKALRSFKDGMCAAA
ncbi:hypothetical protein F5Y04DRAFT_293479 [Hypomontagnella monticulosa]|nr:hypothetical protein F5Y04DRAFT_293479 [Hypomontagnella monticulosa]